MTEPTPTGNTRRKRSGKIRRTQEERRAETVGRLLDASIGLLLERGYSRFRIADAASVAGVSRGGQTHHFATKNDLIEAAIERVFTTEVASARYDAGKAANGDVLTEGAAHIDEFLKSELYQVSLNMLISAGASEHLADGVRAISARNRNAIEDAWIDRLVEEGVDRKSAEDSFWLMWSVQRGMATQLRIGGDLGAADESLDFTLDLLTQSTSKKPNPAPD